MPKRIINLTELARLSERHRTRLSVLIKEGRLIGDYIDNEGFHYWTVQQAQRVARAFKEYEDGGKAGGKGVKLELPRKRTRRTPEDE